MVIFGSGEEAKLAYIAIRALGMKLHGIVDPGQAGKTCLKYEIKDLPWLAEQKDIDLLLVLQSANLNGTFKELKTTPNPLIILQIEI